MEELAFTVIFLDDEHLSEDEVSVVPIIDTSPEDDLEDEAFQAVEVPTAIIPPGADFHTVAVKTQEILTNGPTLIVDRMHGEYAIIRLKNNITNVQILNWAPIPYFSRVILDIYNEGNFAITWPDWIQWSRNRIPEVTDNGNDTYILTNVPNVTVKGQIVGTGYPSVP